MKENSTELRGKKIQGKNIISISKLKSSVCGLLFTFQYFLYLDRSYYQRHSSCYLTDFEREIEIEYVLDF